MLASHHSAQGLPRGSASEGPTKRERPQQCSCMDRAPPWHPASGQRSRDLRYGSEAVRKLLNTQEETLKIIQGGKRRGGPYRIIRSQAEDTGSTWVYNFCILRYVDCTKEMKS